MDTNNTILYVRIKKTMNFKKFLKAKGDNKMSNTTDLINSIKFLNYLQSHSPETCSREDLARYLNVSLRTITRYAHKLEPLGIDSVRGRGGGYAYAGKQFLPMALKSVDDMYAINLSINSPEVIDMINACNPNGIILSNSLIFSNNQISKSDLEKMIRITEAIYLKKAIKIKYEIAERTFNCYVVPICFKNYDGLIYLFGYYRKEVHCYSLPKLTFLEFVNDREKLSISHKFKEDLERIKNMPNHEIYGNDDLVTFRILVKKVAYNRLKKSFKDVELDYSQNHSLIRISTKSYKEVCALLLSCGDNIKFVDKDNEVFKTYKEMVKNMYRRTKVN